MYADPNHLRDREIKLRVDDSTYKLIDALAQFHRTQKAVLVRDLVEAALERLAAEDSDEVTAAWRPRGGPCASKSRSARLSLRG